MVRKRSRGGKAANSKKSKALLKPKLLKESGDEPALSSQDSEESSGTPKSCNTPVETVTGQHKKFGKYRCLVYDESNKAEASGSESDIQIEAIELDPSEVSVVIGTETICDSLKNVNLEAEQQQVIVEEVPAENVTSEIMIVEEQLQIEEIKNNEVKDSDNITAPIILPESKEIIAEVQDIEMKVEEELIIKVEPLKTETTEVVQEIITEQDENTVKKENKENAVDENEEDNTKVRRSSRIRSISYQKQRSKGHGLVRAEKHDVKKQIKVDTKPEVDPEKEDKLELGKVSPPLESPTFLAPTTDGEQKPVKVKSRWRRSSELELGNSSPLTSQPMVSPQTISETPENIDSPQPQPPATQDEEMEKRLKQFEELQENQYLTERTICREAKKMLCDCFMTPEEIERGEFGCGEDCLNRLLMIECGDQCAVGERCTNKSFQKKQYAPCEVFRTEKKGLGIRATSNIAPGEFLLEYVGEVLDSDEFNRRAKEYSKDKNRHYYFMALRAGALIDATIKGNISRFINHSCEPNAETQKWTVNGELRIGFFSKKTIQAGEEITFDYQFQRYGKEAQKCYCEAATCRGWIGEEPDSDDEDDDDDDDDDDDEESEAEEEEGEQKEGQEQVEIKENDKPKEVKVKEKKVPRQPRIRKQRVDDADLDAEIELLASVGIKNRTRTLKLSRLMVRAKDVDTKMKLLSLLKYGADPCKRLFLDYRGLRLIHGWMCDLSTDNKDRICAFKLAVLQTLDSLTFNDKYHLQDSKVLSLIEKWSIGGNESEQSSPIDHPVDPKKEEHMEPIPMDIGTDDESKQEEPSLEEKKSEAENKELQMKTEINDEKVIYQLCLQLVNKWHSLKEVYRIPKKERIEQMKEHEREADKGYKAESNSETESKKYSERYRSEKKHSSKKSERSSSSSSSSRKKTVHQERHVVPIPKMSKHERRQLFALQVAKEEEGRRRKQEEEMWLVHEQRCIMMGLDPRNTSMDISATFWNQFQSSNFPPATPPVFDQAFLPRPPAPLLPNAPLPIMIPPGVSPVDLRPPYPGQEIKEETGFMGPIPPPVKLPPKWKCARDTYGRPYYYHIKIRVSQWEPPELSPAMETPTECDETTSSSDTSSLSSDTTSDSDEDSEFGDTKMLLQVQNKIRKNEAKVAIEQVLSSPPNKIEQNSPLLEIEVEKQVPKRKRDGLVEEIIISPRREEDIIAGKLEQKKYKETKEKVRRQKELLLLQAKKMKVKQNKTVVKVSKRHKTNKISSQLEKLEKLDLNTEEGKRMKETFRKSIASVIVQHLNAYRKPDCKVGRITNTEDFKHLARKLTHFVMSKEIKHCENSGLLTVNDSVKAKSKDLIRKYMQKFGDVYSRPKDDFDF